MRLPHLWLLVPLLVFVVMRLPALIHQPGMQDEQWFAVPGLTVLEQGVPRIPYLPTRRRETLFENADVCLMALPPGLFYVQAPFFALFPAGYATARIPLFLAALVAIVLTYKVTRKLGGSVAVASAAAGIMAISRPLLFTGLTVRPDLLCIVCGWIAILLLWNRQSHDRLRDSLGIGGVCGLGALFHPFALVFCMQVAAASLFAPGTWVRRGLHVICLGCGTIAVLGLWLPLILAFPDEFRSQFFANVLDRAGPGLPSRLLWPLPSLQHHATLLWEFAGPLQTLMMLVSLLFASLTLWQIRRDRLALGYIALTWSSVYLTAAVAGLHPTKGYWTYPFLWLTAMLVIAMRAWADRLAKWIGKPNAVRHSFAAMVLLVFVSLLPGSGARTTWLYLTHWQDPRYFAPAFIRGVLAELPHEGVFYADLSYVFDVYLSGRETRLCQERVQYWGEGELSYDYLILSWEGADAQWAKQYDGQWVRRFGERETTQACFVDIYTHASSDD